MVWRLTCQPFTRIEERDKKDTEREHSPLVPADNSVIIDTSNLNPEEMVEN